MNTLKPGEPGNPAVPGGPGGPLKVKEILLVQKVKAIWN